MAFFAGQVTLKPLGNRAVFLRAGDLDAGAPGMEFDVAFLTKPPGCGTLEFVQNVQPFREIVYKDQSRNRLESSSFLLDGNDPYPTFPLPFGVFTNDSPAQGIDSFTEKFVETVEVRDEFRMFLMFAPKGGARETLEVGAWTFVGQARSDRPGDFEAGQLRLDTAISRVLPEAGKGSPTQAAPVLSPDVASVPFVPDTAGDPSPKAIAISHAPVLNRNPPRPVPNPIRGPSS
jgi:hypothetical protein